MQNKHNKKTTSSWFSMQSHALCRESRLLWLPAHAEEYTVWHLLMQYWQRLLHYTTVVMRVRWQVYVVAIHKGCNLWVRQRVTAWGSWGLSWPPLNRLQSRLHRVQLEPWGLLQRLTSIGYVVQATTGFMTSGSGCWLWGLFNGVNLEGQTLRCCV